MPLASAALNNRTSIRCYAAPKPCNEKDELLWSGAEFGEKDAHLLEYLTWSDPKWQDCPSCCDEFCQQNPKCAVYEQTAEGR
jgi:hypothetical protein